MQSDACIPLPGDSPPSTPPKSCRSTPRTPCCCGWTKPVQLWTQTSWRNKKSTQNSSCRTRTKPRGFDSAATSFSPGYRPAFHSLTTCWRMSAMASVCWECSGFTSVMKFSWKVCYFVFVLVAFMMAVVLHGWCLVQFSLPIVSCRMYMSAGRFVTLCSSW